MKKKITVLTLCALLFALSVSAEAQQKSKIAKIGWLAARPPSGPTGGAELFRGELRKLGYVEGKQFTFEYRSAENKIERLPELADELVRLNVDVMIASSTAEATAAKNATRTIPIVFTQVADPVATGLIDSLARPGGNITQLIFDCAGKRWSYRKRSSSRVVLGNHAGTRVHEAAG
jgi:putative ABC transport system substrate-binding protein